MAGRGCPSRPHTARPSRRAESHGAAYTRPAMPGRRGHGGSGLRSSRREPGPVATAARALPQRDGREVRRLDVVEHHEGMGDAGATAKAPARPARAADDLDGGPWRDVHAYHRCSAMNVSWKW